MMIKKYNKKVFISIIIGAVAILIIFVVVFSRTKKARVCFENNCFDVELAVKPEEQSRGLMFREHLDLDKGMLFIFEEEKKHSFWMKNTLIPLDIIWINKNKEVVFISENVQPCEEFSCPNIKPSESAKYVLEINGGISKKIGLIIGDKIDLDIE